MSRATPSPFLADAPALLRGHRRLAGLPPGAATWLLAQTLEPPAWVVVADPEAVERTARLLGFHLPASYRVMRYPGDDLPPYSGVSPHPRRAGQRIAALDALRRGEPVVIVAPAEALAARVACDLELESLSLSLHEGAQIPRRRLLLRLDLLGYQNAVVVEDAGTYAVRGGVVDLWPTGRADPVRLDFFDEELESLRRFDPETQRSGAALESLRLLPTREWIPTATALQRLAVHTRSRVDSDRDAAALRRRVLETLRSKLSFAGVEDWLPALHPVISPLDCAPAADIAVLDPDAVALALRGWSEQARRRHADLLPDERPLVAPSERYQDPEELLERLLGGLALMPVAIDSSGSAVPALPLLANRDLAVSGGELGGLVSRVQGWLDEGWRVAFAVASTGESERLLALLQPHGLELQEHSGRQLESLPPGRAALIYGDLPLGFRAPEDRLALVATDEILGKHRAGSTRRRHHAFRRSQVVGLGKLRDGDLVVHAWHGIGRFCGMRRVEVSPGAADFVLLEYQGGDRLYWPVHKLDLLSRYRPASDSARPRLDKLGGGSWNKRRRRVRDAMLRTAHELLKLYARRKVVTRAPHRAEPRWFRRFEAAFPYVVTPDQGEAIRHVAQDLAAEEPMDRLVVGDVGFGKTEVAMRAAARVAAGGRQVAVLCPTTVLAYQHQETWSQRFERFPVRIGMLSRFTTPKGARELQSALAQGELDVVIGTTRLLGRGVRFQDLGLMIIDEEHRFGVRQKERIKKLRTQVDVLSLSATPIPRTLSMALSGLRSFSTIATPPSERLAVRTRIARFHEDVIREEAMRELSRGGQVFFVHNRVQTIEAMAGRLQRLLPEARFAVTHGQQPSAQLEAELVRFVRRQADILVTTSIIESGVDLPNVNCVIIDRADTFGLAQLYQVRGRVGRSHRRGRCVLLVPPELGLSRKASRRLRVLLEHQDLGSGFMVASADMEHRGAGTLLGDNQHGHVDAVGFDTYVDLLDEVLAEARGELRRERLDPEIEVPVPAYIPEALVPGVEERLGEYRLLSGAESPAQLRSLLDGMEERYGQLPVELLNLGWLLETRLRCRELGIARISWLKVRVELELAELTSLSAPGLAGLILRLPNRFALPEPHRLHVRFSTEEAEYPFRFLYWLLGLLTDEAGTAG